MKEILLLNKIDKTLVDDNDFELCNKYNWRIRKNNGRTTYTNAIVNGQQVLMHRLIMSAKKGQIVDHINRNGLDNRRCNLRFVTKSENSMNSEPYYNRKYKGVYLDKKKKDNCKKYWAYIWKDNKRYGLKYHKTEEEAALAYNKKAIELYGNIAYLNKV